jgi:hypothetical protein
VTETVAVWDRDLAAGGGLTSAAATGASGAAAATPESISATVELAGVAGLKSLANGASG